MDDTGTGTWWVQIRPNYAFDGCVTREQFLQNTSACGQSILGMTKPWTLFDAAKTDFSLKILSHAAAFLRVRASVLIDHGLVGNVTAANMGVPAVRPHASRPLAADFESVVFAFTMCSEILRKRIRSQALLPAALAIPASGYGNRNGDENAVAITSEGDNVNLNIVGSVSLQLKRIVENLSCVIHDFVVTGSDAELRGVAGQVDAYMTEAGTFSPKSFVGQVYQVVQERVARTRSR